MTLYGRSGDGGGGSGERGLPAETLQSAVALLAHLEKEELDKMNDDETEMISIIDDSEIVKNIQAEREELVTSNKSLAEFNVSLEPTLNERKELLRELYVTQGEIFASFDGKKQTLEKNTGATSLDTILAILQSEAATSDEASEDIAEQFLAGSLPIDGFLSDFRAKRKLTHMQRIKSEKFQEMINKGLVNDGPTDLQQQQQQHPPNILPHSSHQQQQQQQPPQQQNNLSSQWDRSPSTSRPNPHLPSPSRPAPPPPPSSMPYPAQPPTGYPVYGGGHGAAPHPAHPVSSGYWGGQPQPQGVPQGIMTGPPPGSSVSYSMSQPPPHQPGGPPRGGWGQGRAPYQQQQPQQMPYMSMPQPHFPGGYR